VAVSATDDVAVTSANATLTTATGFSATVPLHDDGSGSWQGAFAPMTLAKLLSITSNVTVDVQASDAAGNTATTSTTVKAKLFACA
jgi:hypothetical protein